MKMKMKIYKSVIIKQRQICLTKYIIIILERKERKDIYCFIFILNLRNKLF
jgi:hypothetical protein